MARIGGGAVSGYERDRDLRLAADELVARFHLQALGHGPGKLRADIDFRGRYDTP
jgi:hypothetical protein